MEERGYDTMIYDMLIVGGGPGGYTAALYGARAGLSVLVLEKMAAGGQMTLTSQIDNYPGFPEGVDGFTLGQQMEQGAARFGVQTRYTQVTGLELEGSVKTVHTQEGDYEGRTVIIATGANPRPLGVAEEQELIGRGLGYCAHCDGMFYRDKTVVVVGGGLTGCEIAYDLYLQGKKPTIVEMQNDLICGAGICLANSSYLRDFFKTNQVPVLLETGLKKIEKGSVVVAAKDGTQTTIPADSVILSVGYRPAPLAAKSAHVHVIGDAAKVGNLRTAIWRAWDVAMKL